MGTALYDSFIAEYYDASPVVAGRTHDIAFYRDTAISYGDPVLELGCGTGRVTKAIAEAGHRITGMDISQRMLERASERLADLDDDAKERVQLIEGDMTRFELGEKFRLVIVPFRPFQHLLDIRQQMSCLDCVARHLVRGGKLIVDFFQTDPRRMHDPEFLQERLVAEYDMSGGRRVKLTERVAAFHRAEQRNDVEMIYAVNHADGRTESLRFAFTVRYFFRYEVEHLLARCGYRVGAVYGSFDRSPLLNDSPEMIFVAERP
jgi:ubiquinone/menaquinone biosynthesis C-methylase UbiE